MFILGHTGLTAGAIHSLDRRADLRLVPIFALLPDLVDKPLDILAPSFTNGWTRTVGHSLVGWAVFSIAVALVQRRRSWVAILSYGLHLALDRMWLRDMHVLLWPFLGATFDEPWIAEHSFQGLLKPWVFCGEMAGLAVLVLLWVKGRLWDPGSREAFLATGVLAR